MPVRAPRWVRSAVVFLCSLLLTTILGTVLWEVFVDGTLYNNTDSAGGYPFPADLALRGDWPLQVVDQVVRDNDMSHPDTILKGWSVTGLWCIWFGIFATSVIVSTGLAWRTWDDRPRTKNRA